MNYKIMHKSDIIALADENGINEIINKSLCPACFAIGMPLEIWLDNRCWFVNDMRQIKSKNLT